MSSLPWSYDHSFCLHRAAYWVSDTYDPESCGVCSPMWFLSDPPHDGKLIKQLPPCGFILPAFSTHGFVPGWMFQSWPHLVFSNLELEMLVKSTFAPSVSFLPSPLKCGMSGFSPFQVSCLFSQFTAFPSVYNSSAKMVFLLALNSSCRVGELHALLRRRGFHSFGPRRSLEFQSGPLVIDAWLVGRGCFMCCAKWWLSTIIFMPPILTWWMLCRLILFPWSPVPRMLFLRSSTVSSNPASLPMLFVNLLLA